MQLVKDARAGKTGKALQFLVTGDRSLLKSTKSKDAGQPAAKGRDRRELLDVIETTRAGAGPPAVKGPGDPRPASPRP